MNTILTTVSGTVKNATNDTVVSVNGENATIDMTSDPWQFTARVELAEGENTITAKAENILCGNVDTDSIQVTLDTVAPFIGFLSPDDRSTVKTPAVSVVVLARDENAGQPSVSIDGGPAEFEPDLEIFLADVSLVEGPNIISAAATDIAGNTATASIQVTLDSISPTVTILFPEDGSTTIHSETEVLVQVDGLNTVIDGVSVNGVDAFRLNPIIYVAFAVPLDEGLNSLTATVSYISLDLQIKTVSTSVIVKYAPKIARMTAFAPFSSDLPNQEIPSTSNVVTRVGIRFNGDDDDKNGNPDWFDRKFVGNEDDLIMVELAVNPDSNAASDVAGYVLTRSDANIRVWSGEKLDGSTVWSGRAKENLKSCLLIT